MFAVPDVDEVIEAARSMGMHLGSDEAVLYRKYLIEHLDELDTFVQSRMDEGKPAVSYPAREPGYRPTAEQDPYQAWLWKCRIEGAADGPLAGKTVSYKDHVAVAGIPLTYGSYVMEDFIPDFDATIVSRVLEAGGTVIGKHMMNGLTGGFGFGGGIGDYGRPKNPHNPAHLTGGSSSGSAAALVAGDVDISFGGDQGGSIRIPAAMSGCVGLKPTFGLVSHFGLGFGSDQSIDYTGPMARTIEDTAAALQVTAGYDGLDPRQSREVPKTYDAFSTLTDGVDGLRIGIVEEGYVDAESDVIDTVNAAVEVLSSAGAIVSKVSVPEHLTARNAQNALGAEGSRALLQSGFFGAFTRTYYPQSLIAAINQVWAGHIDLLNPRTKLNYLVGEFARRNYHGRVYAKAQNVRGSYIKAFDRALAENDVLVMPTCILKAPEYVPPETKDAALEEALGRLNAASRNTQPFNYTGHPALAMPCGKSQGLPVSMQLIGKFFDDALLLRIGYAFQHSVDYDSIISVEN